MAKYKNNYSKKMVTWISITLLLFIIAVLILYWHTGSEPGILIGAVFGAALGEYWQLAGIKKAKIKSSTQYTNQDEIIQ